MKSVASFLALDDVVGTPAATYLILKMMATSSEAAQKRHHDLLLLLSSHFMKRETHYSTRDGT